MARFVHNFLGSLALITILKIFIKVWFSESILQYQKPSGPLAKYRWSCSRTDYRVGTVFLRGHEIIELNKVKYM